MHGQETAEIREFRRRAIRFLLLDRLAIEAMAGLHPKTDLGKVTEELAAESEWLLSRLGLEGPAAAQEKR